MPDQAALCAETRFLCGRVGNLLLVCDFQYKRYFAGEPTYAIVVRCHNDNRDLKHRRRGRRRERQKTIVLISKTLTPHVHYTLWYISLPSSAKQ